MQFFWVGSVRGNESSFSVAGSKWVRIGQVRLDWVLRVKKATHSTSEVGRRKEI